MSLIYLPGGASQVPQEVQERLAQIDPRLALFPYKTTLSDSGAEEKRHGLAWRWAVVVRWAENDPRWEMVRHGRYPSTHAFDRIGDIPADVPLDQVPAYLKQNIRPTNAPRHIYGEILKWNADQELRNGTAVMDFAEELISTNAGTLFREQGKTVEKVYQYNPPPKNRLRKGEAVE
jgi:hypothetical protein